MKKLFKIVIAGLGALSLTSCAWLTDYFAGTDNVDPPAELVEFKPDINITERWYLDVDEGSKNQNLQVALTDKTAFVVDYKGFLTAIDPDTGTAKWSRKTGIRVKSGPVHSEGVLYLGTPEAELVAVSAEKGDELWRTSLSSEVLALPTVTFDKVIVRMSDGRVTAVNKADGRPVWTYKRRQPLLSLRGVSRPVAKAGQVLVGLDDGHLVSLAEEDGQITWDKAVTIPRGSTELQRMVDIDADPVVDQGVVYVASYNGKLSAITQSSGQPMWSRDLSIFAGVTIAGSRLFVVDDQDHIWAIDRRTGASYWKQDMLHARRLGAPVVVGDHVLVADLEGYIHAFDVSDGHLSDRKRIDDSGIASMRVLSDTRFVALGRSGEVTMLEILKETR